MRPVPRNDSSQRLDIDLRSYDFLLFYRLFLLLHRFDFENIGLSTDLFSVLSFQLRDGLLVRLNDEVLLEYFASKLVDQTILLLHLLLQLFNFWEEFIEIWLVYVWFGEI